MPAAPRRWVSAAFRSLFAVVYRPDSSCMAKMIGLPRRDSADDVTVSIFPSSPTRVNSSPTRMSSFSGPFFTIDCSGR
jgi:hypothetical protein